jgi:hypothetical protein
MQYGFKVLVPVTPYKALQGADLEHTPVGRRVVTKVGTWLSGELVYWCHLLVIPSEARDLHVQIPRFPRDDRGTPQMNFVGSV